MAVEASFDGRGKGVETDADSSGEVVFEILIRVVQYERGYDDSVSGRRPDDRRCVHRAL